LSIIFPYQYRHYNAKEGRKDKPGLNNMKKTETLTEQNSLYRCLFVPLSVRNRRGDRGALDSSGSLPVLTMCDSTRFCFYALPGFLSYWEVSNNPKTTTITLEDWHEVVWIAKKMNKLSRWERLKVLPRIPEQWWEMNQRKTLTVGNLNYVV